MKFLVSEYFLLKITGFSYFTVGNDDCVLSYYGYYYYWVLLGPASAMGYGYEKFYYKIKAIIIIHHYDYHYFEHQNYWVHDYY